MPQLRRLLLLVCLAMCLAPFARATEPTPDAGMLMISLDHYWVVELAGQRYGLIQFDTPMTTILLGRFNVDLPVPALLVLAPLIAIPALAAIGVVMQARRRRLGFA